MKRMAARLALCLMTVATVASGLVHAQRFPERPISLIVPFAPGGTTDVIGRLIAPPLSALLGSEVVVDNRPGAASRIGTALAAKAEPDGHTLLLVDTTFGIAPALYRGLPYDTQRDFAPVTQLMRVPVVLVVHPGFGVKTVKELVALARARPGRLDFGSGGVGTPLHMTGELMKLAAHIDIVHVPYRGAGPAIRDLLGGHIDMMFPTLPAVLPYIRRGDLRALAVVGSHRTPALPEVPTLAEAGVPGVKTEAWFGLVVPAATPRPLIDRLHADAVRVLQDPAVAARLTEYGAEIVGGSPDEFARRIALDIETWRAVVKSGGIKPDQ